MTSIAAMMAFFIKLGYEIFFADPSIADIFRTGRNGKACVESLGVALVTVRREWAEKDPRTWISLHPRIIVIWKVSLAISEIVIQIDEKSPDALTSL